MKAHRKQVVGVLAIALIACFYILAVHAMQRLEEEMQLIDTETYIVAQKMAKGDIYGIK